MSEISQRVLKSDWFQWMPGMQYQQGSKTYRVVMAKRREIDEETRIGLEHIVTEIWPVASLTWRDDLQTLQIIDVNEIDDEGFCAHIQATDPRELPDVSLCLDDAATKGCLLQIARRAWGDYTANTRKGEYGWSFCCSATIAYELLGPEKTEGEALAHALAEAFKDLE